MIRRILLFLSALTLLAAPASSQQRETPYWASLRSSVINMRVGPSSDYRIAWVYRRPGLPVKVLRVMEGWRFIEDPDGTRGWVASRLLSADRGAIVVGDNLTGMRDDPQSDSQLKWRVEPGVVGALGDCEDGWCEVSIGKRRGWILQNRLWGPGEP